MSSLVRGKWIERFHCLLSSTTSSVFPREREVDWKNQSQYGQQMPVQVFPREREVDWKTVATSRWEALICLPSWEGSGLKGDNEHDVSVYGASSLVRGKWIERYRFTLTHQPIMSSLVRGKWIERLYYTAFISRRKVFPREREVDWKTLFRRIKSMYISLPSWEGSGLKVYNLTINI